jgi:hypothetical protein
MRDRAFLTLPLGLVLAGAAAWATGCSKDAADCDLSLTCAKYAGTSNSAPDGGGDGSSGPDCSIPPMMLGGAPLAGCGVFAAPGATGDGSRAQPFGSLQAAVDAAAAAGQPVYACAKEFAEALRVPSGVAVYGGLDCDQGWVWTAGQRTTVRPAAAATAAGASEIAARLEAGAGTTVLADVDVIAPTGALAGVSSIAVLIEDTAAELARGAFTAGDGTAGAAGAHATDPAPDGASGAAGYGICTAGATNPAPDAVSNACGGQPSTGGQGGDGGPPTGAVLDGANGTSGAPATGATLGLGGQGQTTASCQAGGKGDDGGDGPGGAGAKGPGALTTDGFSGADGKDGGDGKPGQGGGGGGGARGKTLVQCPGAATINRAGATGGGGGAGGCGGARGGGGKAGGSSFAVLSLATPAVTLTDVTLHVGKGGPGGSGGDGQGGGNWGSGAPGGAGATGANAGCAGGDGGHGGQGGPGGGGQGGHAAGVAYGKVAPQGAPAVSYAGGVPKPGLGGMPGAGGAASGAGEAGQGGDLIQIAGP